MNIDASVIISGLALLLSLVIGVRQVRLEIKHRHRADVTAHIAREKNSIGHTVWILHVKNFGPAAARDVGFDITSDRGKPPDTVYKVRNPIPLLDREQDHRIAIAPMQNTAPLVDVALGWSDEEGSKSKKLHLSVY